MAQSYVGASFVVESEEAELDLLAEAIKAIDLLSQEEEPEVSDALVAAFLDKADAEDDADDRLAGLKGFFREVGGDLGARTERDADGKLSVYGTSGVEVESLGLVIRRTCPGALPMAFAYSFSCSKPIEDSFGGGIVTIEDHGVGIVNTHDMIAKFEKATGGEPLNGLQKAAIAAYDDVDGDIAAKIGDLGIDGIRRLSDEGVLGDDLVTFLVREVGDAADGPEAAELLRTAARQLEDVADALGRHERPR
jgi:hypothetical protein